MNKPQLLAAFAVKVLMGFAYGYIFLHYYGGDDTWKFFHSSLSETKLLLDHPAVFFTNEFTPANALETGRDAIEVMGIYLNDLQYVLLVKTMAIMNLATGGNYYLNVVLFNAIFFWGHYWLYALMAGLFPSKKRLYFLVIFLFLPAVFWLSGIRVDGLLFFFLSLLLYKWMGKEQAKAGRFAWIAIAFAGVLICRPQVAVLCALAGLAYHGHRRFAKPVTAYGVVYILMLILFFIPPLYISGHVAQKQIEFSKLKGTTFRLDPLDESPASYLRVLPQAAANTFIRPFPWEVKGILQLLASAEVVAFWIVLILSIVYRHPYWKLRLFHPVILMICSLAVSMYLVTGFIVPYPGAIVRYKSIAEILLLCVAVSLARHHDTTNYKKI